MNELIVQKKQYPFNFFPKNDFYVDLISEHLYAAYCRSIENEPVPTPKELSFRMPEMVTLGQIGRIVYLGEDYHDLFTSPTFNEEVRYLAKEFSGDLIRVHEEMMERYNFFSIGSSGNDMAEDLRMILESDNVFYLDAEYGYYSLEFFHERSNLPHPFSDENSSKIFKNLPIIKLF